MGPALTKLRTKTKRTECDPVGQTRVLAALQATPCPWASHLSQGQPQQPTLRSTSPLGAPTRPSPSPSCQSRHRSGHRPPGQSGRAAQGVGLVLCRGFRAPSKRGCGFGFCPRERKAQPWYLLGRRQGTQRSWDGDHEQASRVPKNARFHRTGWPCPLSSGLW